jgi:hypothetical protein
LAEDWLALARSSAPKRPDNESSRTEKAWNPVLLDFSTAWTKGSETAHHYLTFGHLKEQISGVSASEVNERTHRSVSNFDSVTSHFAARNLADAPSLSGGSGHHKRSTEGLDVSKVENVPGTYVVRMDNSLVKNKIVHGPCTLGSRDAGNHVENEKTCGTTVYAILGTFVNKTRNHFNDVNSAAS